MAKFCQHCGTQLEDGQVCSCPQAQLDAAQSQPQAAPQTPAAPSPIGAAFKNLLPFCKAYLRSPAEATRAAIAQKDLIFPIILLVIQVIAAGLVVFSFLAKVCSSIEDVILKAMGLGNLLTGSSLLGGLSGPSISASFILCLIFGILAAIIAIVLFVVLIFAVAKIMKSTCSIQDVLIACGANSLLVTVLLLLTFILFFASIKVGLILFIISMLAWIITGVITAQAVTPGTEQGKFWLLYIAAVLIALLIGGWVSSKFLGMSVGATKISYAGESIRISEAIDGLGQVDFEDLFEDMLYDLF